MLAPQTFINSVLFTMIIGQGFLSLQDASAAPSTAGLLLLVVYWPVAHGVCLALLKLRGSDLTVRRQFAIVLREKGQIALAAGFVIAFAVVAGTSFSIGTSANDTAKGIRDTWTGAWAIFGSMLGALTFVGLNGQLLSTMVVTEQELNDLGLENQRPNTKVDSTSQQTLLFFLAEFGTEIIPLWVAVNAARMGNENLAWACISLTTAWRVGSYLYYRFQSRDDHKAELPESERVADVRKSIEALGIHMPPVKVRTPKFLGVSEDFPYAAAGENAINVNKRLLESLNHDELMAVMLHEIRHMQRRDAQSLMSQWLSGTAIRALLEFCFIFAPTSTVRLAGVALLRMFGQAILESAQSRSAWHEVEYECDAFAATSIGDSTPMISALKKHVAVSPFGALSFYGSSSHPSLAKRIESLAALKPSPVSPE